MTEPALVCALDRGILRGLFAAQETDVTLVSSIAAGDDCCRLQLTLSASARRGVHHPGSACSPSSERNPARYMFVSRMPL